MYDVNILIVQIDWYHSHTIIVYCIALVVHSHYNHCCKYSIVINVHTIMLIVIIMLHGNAISYHMPGVLRALDDDREDQVHEASTIMTAASASSTAVTIVGIISCCQ